MFNKLLKLVIHKAIAKAIADQDANILRSALNRAYKAAIDESYIPLIAQLLTATWHEEHEDLVDTILLNKLKDEVFTDSLYKIAIKPDLYRKYDDELEATLRKCVHALKMINSAAADAYLEKLTSTQNSNVAEALSIYSK